ncbi:MAG: hypothetical protein ABSG41_07160 [Bryobacteraceae bacterium]
MKHPSTVALTAIASILYVGAALAQQSSAGQKAAAANPFAPQPTAEPAAPTGPAPRTADGKVDLSGNWAPNAIRQNINLASVGGEPPMLPWAEKQYLTNKGNISKDDPEARCLPPGVPRMSTTPYPFSIIQLPKQVVIVYEGGAHVWRKIFLDGRGHDPNVVETWLGDSIGHWEGNDTLVVETTGQNGITWLDQDGHVHTNQMVVTERFRRPDMGHLEIEHTINDPGAYSKPWTFTTHPVLLKGELIEYICQENNRDVQHLVGK